MSHVSFMPPRPTPRSRMLDLGAIESEIEKLDSMMKSALFQHLWMAMRAQVNQTFRNDGKTLNEFELELESNWEWLRHWRQPEGTGRDFLLTDQDGAGTQSSGEDDSGRGSRQKQTARMSTGGRQRIRVQMGESI